MHFVRHGPRTIAQNRMWLDFTTRWAKNEPVLRLSESKLRTVRLIQTDECPLGKS